MMFPSKFSIIIFGIITKLNCLRSLHANVLDGNICSFNNSVLDCSNVELYQFEYATPSAVTAIYLQRNHLSSLRIHTFHNNTNLEILDVSHNSLTVLPAGLFGRLQRLHTLNLSFNQILYTNMPPNLFAGPKALHSLDLSNQHQFQASVSFQLFSPLSSLAELHMTGCFASMKGIEHLTNLRTLDIGDDWCNLQNVTEEYYRPFYTLQKLSKLSFRKCNVQNMSKTLLPALTQLTTLDLSCNTYIAPYLKDAMVEIKNSTLKVLLMDRISTRSDRVLGLQLDLNYILSKHPHLTMLSLDNNSFLSKDPLDLQKYTPCLNYLSIASDAFGFARTMGVLSPSFGYILALLNTAKLQNLKVFDCSYAKTVGPINGFNPFICSQPDKRFLQDRFIWDTLSTKLHCDEPCSPRAELPSIESSLAIIHSELLAGHKVKNILWTLLKHSSIKVFVFSNSHMDIKCRTKFISDSMELNLEELDISNTSFPIYEVNDTNCIIPCPTLKTLKMHNCLLDTLPLRILHGLPNLSHLILSKNNLGGFFATDTKGLFLQTSKELQYLNLSSNGITSLPNAMFSSQSKLKILDLSHNLIQHSLPDSLKVLYLKWLDLFGNPIQFLEESFIRKIQGSDQLNVRIPSEVPCGCSHDSDFFLTWIASDNDTHVTSSHGSELICHNTNTTVSMWLPSLGQTQCIDEDIVQSKRVYGNISMYVILTVVITCLALCSMLTIFLYAWRYSLLYKFYRFKRWLKIQKDSQGILLCGGHGNDKKVEVYVAVHGAEDLLVFMLKKDFIIHTRNHQSMATGYKWENVAKDVDECDIAIILLKEGCFKANEAYKDLLFATEKDVKRIVTVMQGDVTMLLKKHVCKSIRRFLSHSVVVHWPEVLVEDSYVYLYDTVFKVFSKVNS